MMKNTLHTVAFGLLSLTLGAPATAAPGRTETRPLPRFSSVEIHGALHAEVSLRPEQAVEVSGDADQLARVITEVRGDRLIVRPTEGEHHNLRSVLVRIAATQLSALEASGASEARAGGLSGSLRLRASGASQLHVSGLRGGRLQVDASGASLVDLAGEGSDLKAEVSGASRLHARGLRIAAAEVEASGASEGEVCATKTLGVALSGASNLSYYCKPQVTARSLSGFSSLREGGAR